jgi:hypothetical protein
MATSLLGNGLVNTSRSNTRTQQQNYECYCSLLGSRAPIKSLIRNYITGFLYGPRQHYCYGTAR